GKPMTPMRILLCLFLTVAAARSADVAPLDRPVERVRFEKTPLPAALRALGRVCATTILAEPEIAGDVTVEIASGTLRTALVAITTPHGYHFEETENGIMVRRLKT